MSSSLTTTPIPHSSSQCTSSQREHGDSNIIFSDNSFEFGDSWTCYTSNCTLRQRIISCNTDNNKCILSWSCQQCLYGGTSLQCYMCSNLCKNELCFNNQQCYSYECSNSLRAYQCYYDSNNCFESQTIAQYTSSNIKESCKLCALDLNGQDIDNCFKCKDACYQQKCWNNCVINSNFNIHKISKHYNDNNHNNNTNSSVISGNNPINKPILLTPNAIYGIMAMVGLICLILGFWCGKNCSIHSLSKICCKWCIFWCNDDEYNDIDDDIEWNWNDNNNNNNSNRSHDSTINTISHNNSLSLNKNKKKKRKKRKRISNVNNDGTINGNGGSINNNMKHPLNGNNNKNYNSTTAYERNAQSIRLRFPMSPLTSNQFPGQYTLEQSPDVRVAHFATPVLLKKDDNLAHQSAFNTNFPFNDNNQSALGVSKMERMESMNSDEDQPPITTKSKSSPIIKYLGDGNKPKKKKKRKKKRNNNTNGNNLNNVGLNMNISRQDSFDGFTLQQEEQKQKQKQTQIKQVLHQQSRLSNDDDQKSSVSGSKSKRYSVDDMFVHSSSSNDDCNIIGSGNINNVIKVIKKEKIISNKKLTKHSGVYRVKTTLPTARNSTKLNTYVARGISTDSGLSSPPYSNRKQIVVLNKINKEPVYSPPPIKTKSEFRQLLKPAFSADAVKTNAYSFKQ